MDDSCTIYKTADIIGKRWTILILLELFKEGSRPKRFSELKKGLLEITPKILTERLRELEIEGIVSRSLDSKTVPVRSEYMLTKSGQDLMVVVKGLKRWALDWKVKSPACERANCRDCAL